MLEQLETLGKEVSKLTYRRVSSHFVSTAALDAHKIAWDWADRLDPGCDDAILVYSPLPPDLELKLRRWTEDQAVARERARLARDAVAGLRRAGASELGNAMPHGGTETMDRDARQQAQSENMKGSTGERGPGLGSGSRRGVAQRRKWHALG
jgi:hypothetical protein